MNPEQSRFLSLIIMPARLNPEQAAWLLGFQAHDIPILVASRELKPLGNPPANAVKYFSTAELMELRSDPRWMNRVTNALYRHWREKNSRKSRPPVSPQAGEAA